MLSINDTLWLIYIVSFLLKISIQNDLMLFDPIRKHVLLRPIYDVSNPNEEAARPIDRTRADYIANELCNLRRQWREALSTLMRTNRRSFSPGLSIESSTSTVRRPKAIIFSEFRNVLQGVGTFLYLDPRLGDRSICEHDGIYRSSELSRFRHSKRKYRKCPLCSHENLITSENFCEKLLFLVEYAIEDTEQEPFDDLVPQFEPAAGGHGFAGPGGHFSGACLCSPIGCHTNNCRGYHNALGGLGNYQRSKHLALVSGEHIMNYSIGRQYHVGEMITILAHEPSNDESSILWRSGRLGGPAMIKMWKRCGGRSFVNAWHPGKLLDRVTWQVEEDDASILLLHEDGSHGLDLSFTTHIFLLDRVSNPALENQIISRAHRMGATGPVQVVTLEVDTLQRADESHSGHN